MKRTVPLLLIIAILLGAIWWMRRSSEPNIETIATASLNGMREQNRLSAFTANYAAVVTSEQSRYGLSAKKTLIMQGMVRYEIDMAKITANDVRWDTENQTLNVRLPPIEVAQPQIDLNSIQEYGEGGILRTLTNVDNVLDSANRQKGEAELIRQAKGPVPMGLARTAFKNAIAQNFAAPLKASGIEAKVVAFHTDEPKEKITTRFDYSTPIGKVMK